MSLESSLIQCAQWHEAFAHFGFHPSEIHVGLTPEGIARVHVEKGDKSFHVDVVACPGVERSKFDATWEKIANRANCGKLPRSKLYAEWEKLGVKRKVAFMLKAKGFDVKEITDG